MVALAQVIEEEKGPILDDWTTNRPAVLMNLLNRFGEGSQIRHPTRDRVSTIALEHRMIRVEPGILAVVITRAVELVRSRLN